MLKRLVRELRRKLTAGAADVDALVRLADDRFAAADHDGAEAALSRALELDPARADALHGLGVLAAGRGESRRAVDYFSAALEISPDVPEWLSNCGEACRSLGETGRAIDLCRRALSRAPQFAHGHVNLGAALADAGLYDDAEHAYLEAVRLQPDDPAAHVALGMLQLLRGDLESGWAEYAWRRRLPDHAAARPALRQPLWNGEPLPGGTILLYGEQGYGDTIQFVRYAPLAAQRCGRLLLNLRPELQSLVAGACPPGVELVGPGESVSLDAHASLLDLPGLIGTKTLADIPAATPYLAAPPERVEAWSRVLGDDTRLRVGLVWAGSPRHRNDANRSCSPAHFAALASVEGAAFYSLQKDRPAAAHEWPRDARSPLLELPPLDDFGDTAGLIQNLDLVISVDTSVAHLAGALGKKVWTVLPFAPDWRWLQGRDDSPWYPTMRLFRQRALGDWPELFERVRAALEREAARR